MEGARSRHWCFTWNNPVLQDDCAGLTAKDRLLSYFRGVATGWVFQLEEGLEEKTRHYQGYVHFKNQVRFETLHNRFEEAHWEWCHDPEASIVYCQKLEGRVALPVIHGCRVDEQVLDPYSCLEEKDWQTEILNTIGDPVDNRRIWWYWDPLGATGKSVFAKHLCLRHDALLVGGGAADILYGVSEWLEAQGALRLLVIDIPRSSFHLVSYRAIECIKNGLFFSTKYKSAMRIFNPPHLFVFANQVPENPDEHLSWDRWNVRRITN